MVLPQRIAVVGAGIGGLASALRLAHAGCDVHVFEAHAAPGGKMRTVASAAGPVDAGPTVLTMRGVFDDLFADVGERLEDHLTLHADTTLARHHWSDGTVLDLSADPAASAANVRAAFGPRAEAQFRAFSERAARLWSGFEAPVMQAARPTFPALLAHVLRHPRLIRDMAPGRTLSGMLRGAFEDPRLAQLFGRYATYVGGAPDASPALLALIWQAEARGVWSVDGGMHALARAIEALAVRKGARFAYGTPVTRIETRHGAVAGIEAGGQRIPVDGVVFNGDPAALAAGLLGDAVSRAVPRRATQPRSLSACVLAFAARASGPPLAHHTVFFGDDPGAEFAALARGRLPADPTLYVCAQDHGRDEGPGRYEIIMNAPPSTPGAHPKDATCATTTVTKILQRLERYGLRFDPPPGPADLTTPEGYETLFPASAGSLYGRSPHGTMAAFARPTAATAIPGLVLAGGGTHPGAGVPMAAISGRHAAAAMLAGRTSTSTSRRTDMPGGTSTASRTTAAAPSRSSAS